jgi:hypothetical protein
MRYERIVFVIISLPICLAQTDHPGSMTVGGGVNPVTLTANGTDSYIGALPKPILSYQDRVCYVFTPDVTNTGPASLAISGLAPKSIVRQDGSALSNGDLDPGVPYVLCYSTTAGNLVAIGIGTTASGVGGGGGSPGGSSGMLQFNNGGTSFGGLTGSSVTGSRLSMGGKLDMGAGAGFRPPSGTTLPLSCEVGEQFFKTDAQSGQNSFGCTAPDTWTLQGDGGGSASATGCASGPGIHIPTIGGARCAKGTAEDPWAWGGLDFPNPASAGTSCVNLSGIVPTGWNGVSAPDIQLTYARPDGTFSAGNKLLFSAKTWYVAEGSTVGGDSLFNNAVWNTETLADVSPTGSDTLAIDQKYTSTIRSLSLGSSPNQAAPKGTVMIQLCRQATGAGGRTDSLPASVRVEKAIGRWSTGTRVTSTVGTTAAGTSVVVATVHGAVNSASQKILILGAGAAGANYAGTVSSVNVTTSTLTVSPATTTSVPANTLVAFEASLYDEVFHFTGTGPDSASGGGGTGPAGSQLLDQVTEWTVTNGTLCNITGVSLPVSASTTCVTNAGSDPESGIQFPDNSAATNCVYLRTKAPPNWDSSTAPTLLLTWAQVGAGTGNVLMNAATWSIVEGATYNSPSYAATNCTVMAATGDMKKQTIQCPDLSIAGAGAGRAMKIRICRAGADALDSSNVPIRFYESALRWTVTSACPAP